MTIQLRGDTAANWTATNPILTARQVGLETDTRQFKVGDGASTWTALAYWGGGGGGVSDGDKGDITVSGGGTAWAIDASAVTLAKMANMATASLIYRKTAGTGAPEVNTLATLKTDLGLTGTNSGDQASIVGITGTKAQFDTAVTDGNILYVGDVTQYTDEQAQDAIGAMVDASLTYVDGTPLLQRSALTGDVTATAGGNATTIANDAVTNAKLANVATSTVKGRATAGTGDPEDLTATQVRTLINVADGATANSSDATLLARANHTGTQAASTISDFASAARAQTEAELVAGTNITITPSGSGATRQLTVAASGGASATYGTATINFGAFPGSNEASVAFTDAAIGGTAKVDAFITGGDTTSDHTAADHRYAPQLFSLSAVPSAGVGGTIYARSIHKMQGTFAVRWRWAA